MRCERCHIRTATIYLVLQSVHNFGGTAIGGGSMQPNRKYVPFLRAKRGELGALGELTRDVKETLLPLLEVQPFEDPSEAGLTESYANFAGTLSSKWGPDHPILVEDRVHQAENATAQHPLQLLFQSLEESEIDAIPVTGFGRDDDHNQTIQDLAKRKKRLALRLTPDDVASSSHAATQVADLFERTALSHDSIDLILDIGTLPPQAMAFNLATVKSLYSSIPDLDKWRSVTLGMNSFPEQIRDHVSISSIGEVPRSDWQLYLALLATPLKRELNFGDYAVDNPDVDLSGISGAILGNTMVATIRYSTEDTWLIMRGTRIRVDGNEQYATLAETLRSHSKYKGATFSAGDQFVADCANGTAGPGNAERWRRMAVNHHLTLVVRQLTNLP